MPHALRAIRVGVRDRLSTNAGVTARVTEWQPTSIRDVPGLLFFASALAIVTLMARSERRVPWPTLAWLGVFFLIGVYAQRGVAWWPIAAVAAVAGRSCRRSLSESRSADPDDVIERARRVCSPACLLALPSGRQPVPGAGVPADVVEPGSASV